MLLVEFKEKIKAIKIQENYDSFKKAVIKEYSIPKEQISKIFFSCKDEKNNIFYVRNEEDYSNANSLLGSILFKIEFQENEINNKNVTSIDLLLLKGDIDTIIEMANKKIIELKNEKKNNEIKLRRIIKKLKNNSNDIIHKGIYCNECDNEIKGIRYKCCICQKYNLCEKCEKKCGVGHNHPLLKIRKPELCPIIFSCCLK